MRSHNPRAYDDSWHQILNVLRTEHPAELTVRSKRLKLATLNLEFHSFKGSWLHEADRQLKEFLRTGDPSFAELRKQATENHQLLISYRAEKNPLLNELVLVYRGSSDITFSTAEAAPMEFHHIDDAPRILATPTALSRPVTLVSSTQPKADLARLAAEYPQWTFSLDPYGQIIAKVK